MNIRSAFTLAAIVVFLTGCASAPQNPVSLARDAVNAQSGRIGVAMTALPKLDTRLPGADCLLCIAAASAFNSSLIDYSRKLSSEELSGLKDEMADTLRKRGADVVVIEGDLNIKALKDYSPQKPGFARKDFSPLQKKYGIDRLLVIDITALGFIRTYSAYIPTSDPKGQLEGVGYIVNLKDNAYDWYQTVSITKSADQNWDEPPKFPGLTNAYYQSIETGKDSFLQPFGGDATAPVAAAALVPALATASATQPQ